MADLESGLVKLAEEMRRGFDLLASGIGQTNQKLDGIGRYLLKIDENVVSIELYVRRIDSKILTGDTRIAKLEKRMDRIEKQVNG